MNYHVWKYVGYGLVGAVLCTLVLMLYTAEQHAVSQPGTAGKLIFQDDFEREGLGAHYRQGEPDPGHKGGTWRIQEFCTVKNPGDTSDAKERIVSLALHRSINVNVTLYCDRRLVGENIHNAALWLQRKLPDRARVEFEATPLSKNGDVKAEIFGDGLTHQSGYILIMGGWSNQLNIIARQDEHGEDRKKDNRCVIRNRRRACATEGQTYRWAIERDGDTVRWYVDDALFMIYPDGFPLSGKHFGFNNWEAKVAFDDLRISEI